MPATAARNHPAVPDSCHDFAHCECLQVGVVSDTHGYIDPDIHDRLAGCDLILHAGDIGSSRVLHQLREICENVIAVQGNNDCTEKWAAREHQELMRIGKLAEIKLPGGSVVLMHGDAYGMPGRRHAEMRQHFADSAAIVYGHSHMLVCDQEKKPWVLNPGAAGKARTGGGASCLRMSVSAGQWKVVEFRAPQQKSCDPAVQAS